MHRLSLRCKVSNVYLLVQTSLVKMVAHKQELYLYRLDVVIPAGMRIFRVWVLKACCSIIIVTHWMQCSSESFLRTPIYTGRIRTV